MATEPLDDTLINKLTWKILNALVLVGSTADGERNAMTTSWITQLSMDPVEPFAPAPPGHRSSTSDIRMRHGGVKRH